MLTLCGSHSRELLGIFCCSHIGYVNSPILEEHPSPSKFVLKSSSAPAREIGKVDREASFADTKISDPGVAVADDELMKVKSQGVLGDDSHVCLVGEYSETSGLGGSENFESVIEYSSSELSRSHVEAGLQSVSCIRSEGLSSEFVVEERSGRAKLGVVGLDEAGLGSNFCLRATIRYRFLISVAEREGKFFSPIVFQTLPCTAIACRRSSSSSGVHLLWSSFGSRE